MELGEWVRGHGYIKVNVIFLIIINMICENMRIDVTDLVYEDVYVIADLFFRNFGVSAYVQRFRGVVQLCFEVYS